MLKRTASIKSVCSQDPRPVTLLILYLVYEMLLAGHDMDEPYLASQLQRFQNTSRDALRKKLNISVKVDRQMWSIR